MLWSHDMPRGVLCFHVVWLVGLVGWCVGCLAGWVVWQLRLFIGCLAGCGMLCGVCTLWCVQWHFVVCSGPSCGEGCSCSFHWGCSCSLGSGCSWGGGGLKDCKEGGCNHHPAPKK